MMKVQASMLTALLMVCRRKRLLASERLIFHAHGPSSLAGEESSHKGKRDVRKHIKMLECHTRIAFGMNMEELNQQLEHERSGNRVINQYLCNGMMT